MLITCCENSILKLFTDIKKQKNIFEIADLRNLIYYKKNNISCKENNDYYE